MPIAQESLASTKGATATLSLRAETRTEHEAIDSAMSCLDLTNSVDYAVFLDIHRVSLRHLQQDWRPSDCSDFAAMTRCLEADLRGLGAAPSTAPPATRKSLTAAGQLGVAYVIRGSRLGSAVLRRRVPSTLPTSFLDFSPALSWHSFNHELQQITATANDDQTSEIRAGAKLSFGVFTRAATLAMADRS